ncbi:hypothetical protein SAZ10_04210 [Mesorhizobium sp. BAC0120]|uniref:hypothetical protein n=1 Tax=Mesorhizobium sp. BAC0120 TaxID=3090670 RepID=UPI00298BCA81|nr:hypothetical protein [Mesorhizobium sp. BAC0120]MDW6020961.1 hypothetical protein [Mesorhizobium sp. BAC0120]
MHEPAAGRAAMIGPASTVPNSESKGKQMQGDLALDCNALRNIAFSLAATALVAFEGNIVTFFSGALADLPGWRAVYYAYWLATLGVAAIVIVNERKIVDGTWPALVTCFISAAFVLLHPVDFVAKNYLVAMGLCASLTVLSAACGITRVLRLGAAITAFSAAMCLVDILLPHGFTNSVGRAAGLAQGPNVAAAQLILGAAVTWRAVPKAWRQSFVVLVAAGVFVTLSRSNLLIAATVTIVALTPATIKFLQAWPSGDRLIPDRRAVVAGLLAVFWIGTATATNDRFVVAADSAYHSVGEAKHAIVRSLSSIDILTDQVNGEEAGFSDELIELDQRVLTEGMVDSASARSLLLRRALIRFFDAPWLGLGLVEAHALVPHNTYLLFALAFGWMGFLIPLLFVGTAAFYVWARRDTWEFPVAAAALFTMSHDILLFPASIAIFALGFCQYSVPNPPFRLSG